MFMVTHSGNDDNFILLSSRRDLRVLWSSTIIIWRKNNITAM